MPVCALPGPSKQSNANDEALLAYLLKVGCMGPVLLRMPPAELGGSAPLVLRCLESGAACMVSGLKIDEDEMATAFLDKGALVAFFERGGSASQSDETELELQNKVLGSFARGRVGILENYCVSVTPYESVLAAANAIKYDMNAALNSYYANAMSFLFEIGGDAKAWTTDDPEVISRKHTEVQALMADLALFAKSLVKEFEKENPGKRVHIYLQHTFAGIPALPTDSIATIATTMRESVHAAVISRIVSTDDTDKPIYSPYSVQAGGLFGFFEPDSSHLADIIGAFIKTIVTDRPDGMFTTVVCDEHGIALGLVYSNEESVRTAIFESRGIYWSRSRKSLWRKGDTSGHHQTLLQIGLDCDGDALRFKVIQHGSPGAFCHLNTRTCWGEATGVTHLQSVLQDRLKSAPPGSYTKRLFDDPDLLQKKLLEEVQELVEAKDPDHIAAEAADVMYFMLTRCVAGGATLQDIERHLDKRTLKVSRRPGNAKEWRSANAESILEGGKGEAEAANK